jgi:uncharacterized OsmC-like protein
MSGATDKANRTNTSTIGRVNGVEVDKLFETIDAIKTAPNLADFTFRVSNKWLGSSHNRSTINGFYGAGQEHASRSEPFVLDSDEPPILLGTDLAPNAGEYLLHALAACVTSALVYHAAARGIRLEQVSTRIEGDVDLRGFLGLDDRVPPGFQRIRITFRLEADVPDDQLEALCELGPRFSPVFDTITRGVNVEVKLQR